MSGAASSSGEQPLLGPYADSEFVLGFVNAVGTDYTCILTTLVNYIQQYGYKAIPIRLSACLPAYVNKLGLPVQLSDENEEQRIRSRMKAGNEARRATKCQDFMALEAASQISASRIWPPKSEVPERLGRTVHILLSLKRPEEVQTLRRIYGAGLSRDSPGIVSALPHREHEP